MTDPYDIIAAERAKGGNAAEVASRLRGILTLEQRAYLGDLHTLDYLTRLEQGERLGAQRAFFNGAAHHEAPTMPAAHGKAQARHTVQERPKSREERRVEFIGIDKVEQWKAFAMARGHYLRKPLQEALVEELDKAIANLRASAQGQLRSADELEIIANACRAAGVKTVGELPIEFAVQVMERIEARPAA